MFANSTRNSVIITYTAIFHAQTFFMQQITLTKKNWAWKTAVILIIAVPLGVLVVKPV